MFYLYFSVGAPVDRSQTCQLQGTVYLHRPFQFSRVNASPSHPTAPGPRTWINPMVLHPRAGDQDQGPHFHPGTAAAGPMFEFGSSPLAALLFSSPPLEPRSGTEDTTTLMSTPGPGRSSSVGLAVRCRGNDVSDAARSVTSDRNWHGEVITRYVAGAAAARARGRWSCQSEERLRQPLRTGASQRHFGVKSAK